jgi:hypothetical protein
MRVETEITLTDGRTIRTDSLEFRDRLAISTELLDELGLAESTTEGLWDSISALVTAVVAMEARGTQFD